MSMRFKMIGILVCLMVVCVSFVSAGPAKKASRHAGIFKGEWTGDAVFAQGKSKGTKLSWQIKFGTGNFDEISGIAINNLYKGRLGKLDKNSREVKMTLWYKIAGAGDFSIDITGTFNAGFSVISGNFRNVMGSGPVELKKKGCIPGADRLKGTWKGIATWTSGKFKKRNPEADVQLALPAGTLSDNAEADFFADMFSVSRIEPSAWDPDTRTFAFALVAKIKGRGSEIPIMFTGVFDETGMDLEGTFLAARIGGGEFSISRDPNRADKRAPAPEKLKGVWKGQAAWTAGKYTKRNPEGDLELNLETGALDAKAKAAFFAKMFKIDQIKAKAWDADTRSFTFVLISKYKGRGAEIPFTFTGIFSEDGSELKGTFKALRQGTGTFSISRAKP